MKKVSICIGCYNEEGNVFELYRRLTDVMEGLPQYEYEIIFEDNASTDNTQNILRDIAAKDKRVKCIFNMRNYGVARSGRNCVYNASGDVVVSIVADLQDPPELIPELLKRWEEGNSMVLGVKTGTNDSGIKFKLRELYYKIIERFSEYPQIKQYSGFGAVDRTVYEQIKQCDERTTSFRHLLADLGYDYVLMPYQQEKRKSGKSSYNLWRSFDFSITSLVSTSKMPIRAFTIGSSLGILFSVGLECILLPAGIFNRNKVIRRIRTKNEVFLLACLQMFITSMVGEYTLEVVEKNRKRPLVIEK